MRTACRRPRERPAHIQAQECHGRRRAHARHSLRLRRPCPVVAVRSRTRSKDYYKILGLTQAATPAEIKKAYPRLAFKHHPDRNPGDPQAAARFIEIAEAYETLADPE